VTFQFGQLCVTFIFNHVIFQDSWHVGYTNSCSAVVNHYGNVGRPVNVKRDERCVMVKAGERQKNQRRGNCNLHSSFVNIKCSKTHVQRFVLLVICCFLVVTGHCYEFMTHRLTAVGAVTCHHKIQRMYKLWQNAA